MAFFAIIAFIEALVLCSLILKESEISLESRIKNQTARKVYLNAIKIGTLGFDKAVKCVSALDKKIAAKAKGKK